MEDDPAKEDNQPSASKKESQRIASTHELYNERRKYEERRDDHASNSESFTSGSYSGRSRIDMADARPEIPKVPLRKREDEKKPEKKKRGRRPGRVDKRRRSGLRRAPLRRAPKRKPRKDRELSVSTIFTKLSSQSGVKTPGCKFCGHRCCRRRFEYAIREAARRYSRWIMRNGRRETLTNPENLIRIGQGQTMKNIGSKLIQVGSRSMMLSPLFISSTPPPPENVPEEKNHYCEITPEMIYETLKELTMWKQSVLTSMILDFLKRRYPVNRDESALQSELAAKLRVAVVVGIVTCESNERWCLNCALHKNRVLSKSHVTRFWQVYADTLSPIKNQATAKQGERNNFRLRMDADSLNDFV